MGSRPDREPSLPPLTIDVAESLDPGSWPPLPTTDRVQVGGHTVWTGPFEPPVLVAQPNRWGVIESSFPPAPCVVEVDAEVAGHLPLPHEVVRFIDRRHRPVDPPAATAQGKDLMRRAQRLSKMLSQIPGVVIAATPFARTIPITTPVEAEDVIVSCRRRGLVGLRSLPGLAGGIAVSVQITHSRETLERIAAVLDGTIRGTDRVGGCQ